MGVELKADMFPPESPYRKPLPMPGRGRGKGNKNVPPSPPVNHPHSQYCDTCGENFQQKPGTPPRCNRCKDGMAWLGNIKKRNPKAYQLLVSSLQ